MTAGAPEGSARAWWLGLGVAAALLAGVAGLAVWTAPVRASIRVYTGLIAAANRQDLDAAGRLCSSRYRATHPLRPAREGGLRGFPRNLPHQNFQAWRHGPDVLLCPTNRVGPVYRFVFEDGAWRFDGPTGVLRGRGEFVAMPDGLPGDGSDGDDDQAPP